MDRARTLPVYISSYGFSCLVFLLLATIPLYVNPYLVILLTSVFMYVVLTLSWAIFSGPTRYISLASSAFFGVGVYTSAVLGEVLPIPAVIFLGGIVGSLLAFCIGILTLRLRGMYFIIFTFGVSELMRHFLLWWETNMKGTVGRFVVSMEPETVYYFMLVIFAVCLIVAHLLKESRFGLSLRSIGEHEEAALHIGINVTLLKTLTFALSAFFMSAAGAIMATRWTYIDPSIAFNPLFSFMPVLMAIFGGIGRLSGPIVGAAIFAILEEILITRFPYYYMLIFGVILILVILFLPNGLVGLIKRKSRRSS
ncbi:MAG: branched-chain amino acid ABC transporter permease [Desulfobacterales bacterium]|nr:branched-chain amino acid ABC transporter permease [Desulfobacterales bacterium]